MKYFYETMSVVILSLFVLTISAPHLIGEHAAKIRKAYIMEMMK